MNLFRGIERAAQELGFEVSEASPVVETRQCKMQLENDPPMMFRAQISGRCSLQFASQPEHLQQWKKEWVRSPSDGQPCYQYDAPTTLQKTDRLYQIQVKFPYRLCSNSGQDSIFRPVLGKDGIPILPGSSVKGAFRRACVQWDKLHGTQHQLKYCGTTEKPGALRFHSAYPVGDWSERMVDIVHSQQDWQVGKQAPVLMPLPQPAPRPNPQPERPPQPPPLNAPPVRPANPRPAPGQQLARRDANGNRQGQEARGKSAVALISLYQPTMIFEFSRGGGTEEINWQDVERLFNLALNLGIGGKTSTGYGYGKASKPNYARNKLALHVPLKGTGVISKLLGNEPEFRPNLFKASLRSHLRRLLAGVCDRDVIVEQEANRWFGCTDSEGIVQLFWEPSQPPVEDSQIYQVQGTLHLNSPDAEREVLHQVFQFAYIMGGFGKSWRRVAHSEFYPSYPQQQGKYHIGCHWSSSDTGNWLSVKSKQQLIEFLKDLHQRCQNWATDLGAKTNAPLNWREAWHPNRVAVYAKEVTKSEVIRLFHHQPEHPFKSTPAICGKQRVQGNGKPTFVVSSVWHRMLPIPENRYLEIVTVFHGDRTPWRCNSGSGTSQLQPFIDLLTHKGLTLAWGNAP